MTSNPPPLLTALRQYRHNHGKGFVFGYDKAETDRIVAKLVEALEAAHQFITNGVALGYIQIPDADTPDPAHGTLPAIEAALATHRKGGE